MQGGLKVWEAGITLDCPDREGLSKEGQFTLNCIFKKVSVCLFFSLTLKEEDLKSWKQLMLRPSDGTCLAHEGTGGRRVYLDCSKWTGVTGGKSERWAVT